MKRKVEASNRVVKNEKRNKRKTNKHDHVKVAPSNTVLEISKGREKIKKTKDKVSKNRNQNVEKVGKSELGTLRRNDEVVVEQSEAVVGNVLRTCEIKQSKKKKRKENDVAKEGKNKEEKKSMKKRRKEHEGSPEDGVPEEKKAKKARRKELKLLKEGMVEKKTEEADMADVHIISSGDEDSSKGMKKWLTEYHQNRPGLKVLQQRIDELIVAHEETVEQEKREREALAAEGGWTVVTHHKGRKKTTDSETGTTVGSIAQAVVEDQMTKKKPKELGDFYRFQKREAQRNELLTLRSKYEQDKKRIQQLRAARKFRPY